MPYDVAETATFGAKHAETPARLGREVDHVGNGRTWRRGEAVLEVLVALPEDLQVERQHQRRALCRTRTFDEADDEIAVTHHVHLKPEW